MLDKDVMMGNQPVLHIQKNKLIGKTLTQYSNNTFN